MLNCMVKAVAPTIAGWSNLMKMKLAKPMRGKTVTKNP